MASKREAALTMLYKILEDGLGGVPVKKNANLPEKVPESGLCIVSDGKPGEPQVTLSPLTYHYAHSVPVEIFVPIDDDPDSLLDELAVRVGTILAKERTLKGLCDWVEAAAPETDELVDLGMAGIKAALITVTLHYDTQDPLK